jgi:hypothetical protein
MLHTFDLFLRECCSAGFLAQKGVYYALVYKLKVAIFENAGTMGQIEISGDEARLTAIIGGVAFSKNFPLNGEVLDTKIIHEFLVLEQRALIESAFEKK